MERSIGSFFPHEDKIIEVIYDEFNDCTNCIYDPERCDEVIELRGTCCNRLYQVIFQEAKPREKKK